MNCGMTVVLPQLFTLQIIHKAVFFLNPLEIQERVQYSISTLRL